MSSNGYYADHYFIELCSEFLNRNIVIYPIHPNQGWIDGRNVIEPISCKSCSTLEPLYLLYYSENIFTSPHY